MAVPLKTVAGFVQNKNFLNLGLGYGRWLLNGSTRTSHILRKNDSEEKIVMADSGAMIVCWHPQPKFPYECSLPIPTSESVGSVNQYLKVQKDDVAEVFHFEKPQFQREYLMKTTATTKHRWFPRLGRKFAKKNKPDREFL